MFAAQFLRATRPLYLPRLSFASACMFGVAALSALALVGWASHQLIWASFRPQYIPMAPNTALMFLLLSGGLWVSYAAPVSGWRNPLIWGVAAICIGLSGATLARFFLGLDAGLDPLLFRASTVPPAGQTSPITAGLFLLATAALLAFNLARPAWASGLASGLWLASNVILIGYWYEAPLFYGSAIVPVALPSALAMSLWAMGLITAAGPNVWPLNSLVGPSTQARLSRALLPAMLLFILVEGRIDALREHSPEDLIASTFISLIFVVLIEFTIWRVSRTVGRAVDSAVAEQRRAETQLQQSRDLYMKLLENFPALIWRSGLDAQCDYFNPAWLDFTGRSLAQELGAGWAEGVHPDDFDHFLHIYRQAFERRAPFEMEYRLRHHTGNYRWILDLGRPFNGLDGQFAGFIGFCYDISDKKQRRSEEEAIAEERRRIAREIHDGLAQDLAALRVRVGLWHDLVDANPAQMHDELEHLQTLLRDNIREVRRSIFALRPVALEELGFLPALRQFIADFGEQNQLHIVLRLADENQPPPAGLEAPLFRILQETLHNVAKHAEADSIWIDLDIQPDAAVCLTVRDNGRGFDVAALGESARHGHLGLRQLQERIEDLHGHLTVASRIGQGAVVNVTLPSVRV